MKRNTLNFLVDFISALVLLGIIATGLIIRFVLPPGSGRGTILWTLNRHEWGDVHFWVSVAAGVLLLVHVALHWQWVCVTAVRLVRRGQNEPSHFTALSRNLAGIAFMVCLVGLFVGFIWIARANVESTGGGSTQQRHAGRAGKGPHTTDAAGEHLPIRGFMTLGEVAAASGIPVEDLRTRLGLPATVLPSDRLGQLRQQYGFTMEQVREIVAAEQQELAGPPRH